MPCVVYKSRDTTLRQQLKAMGLDPNPNTPDHVLDRVRPGGETFITCGKDPGVPCPCGHISDILCDFPVGRGKTCDLALCSDCAHHVGEDRDLCAIHWNMFSKDNPVPHIFSKGPRLVRE